MTELETLEAKIKLWFEHIAERLHLIHQQVDPNVATNVPPLPTLPTDVSTAGNDPTVAVELTPQMALANGQQGNANLHYWNYLRSLSPNDMAAWCRIFLTQDGATVPDVTESHAIVSVGGVAYPVTNEAQGIIISLANSSGAQFPIS